MRHLCEALLNPFFLILVLIALMAIFKKNARKPLVLIGGLLLVISTGFLPQWLTKQLEHQYPIVKTFDPRVHWIVVFSGGQSGQVSLPANMQLNGVTIERLVEGVRLYRMSPLHTKLVLSGGGLPSERPEAQNMAAVANEFNIPSQAIVIEDKSENTVAEAQALPAIVGQAPFYLVTSAIHMPRAMALCKKYGLNPIAAPTDFTYFWDDARFEKQWIPNSYNMVYLSIALHELGGRLYAQ